MVMRAGRKMQNDKIGAVFGMYASYVSRMVSDPTEYAV
jgi:hypothetical protein